MVVATSSSSSSYLLALEDEDDEAAKDLENGHAFRQLMRHDHACVGLGVRGWGLWYQFFWFFL